MLEPDAEDFDGLQKCIADFSHSLVCNKRVLTIAGRTECHLRLTGVQNKDGLKQREQIVPLRMMVPSQKVLCTSPNRK